MKPSRCCPYYWHILACSHSSEFACIVLSICKIVGKDHNDKPLKVVHCVLALPASTHETPGGQDPFAGQCQGWHPATLLPTTADHRWAASQEQQCCPGAGISQTQTGGTQPGTAPLRPAPTPSLQPRLSWSKEIFKFSDELSLWWQSGKSMNWIPGKVRWWQNTGLCIWIYPQGQPF